MLFTNGSKLEGNVEGQVLCKELSLRLIRSLSDCCGVFHAAVAAY